MFMFLNLTCVTKLVLETLSLPGPDSPKQQMLESMPFMCKLTTLDPSITLPSTTHVRVHVPACVHTPPLLSLFCSRPEIGHQTAPIFLQATEVVSTVHLLTLPHPFSPRKPVYTESTLIFLCFWFDCRASPRGSSHPGLLLPLGSCE